MAEKPQRKLWIPVAAPAESDGYGALHASTHQNGGIDEISVAGLSGLLADPQYPTGPADGDLRGAYPNPTVDGLRGRPVATTIPTDGYALVWNETAFQWEPQAVTGGGVLPWALIMARLSGRI